MQNPPIWDPLGERIIPDDPRSPLVFGLVYSTDDPLSLGRVQVQFNQYGGMITKWLSVIVPKTMNDKFNWIPDVGEQVACLMDNYLQEGAVLGCVPSSVDPPPSGSSVGVTQILFGDGTLFSYNRTTHVANLGLASGAQAIVQNPGGQKIQLDSSGNVNVVGNTVNVSTPSGGSVVLDDAGDVNVTAAEDVNVTGTSINLLGPVVLGDASGGNASSPGPIQVTTSGGSIKLGTLGTFLQLVTAAFVALFNNHVHTNGNNGADTGTPTTQMGAGELTSTLEAN